MFIIRLTGLEWSKMGWIYLHGGKFEAKFTRVWVVDPGRKCHHSIGPVDEMAGAIQPPDGGCVVAV